MVTLDVQRHLLPGCPVATLEAAVVVLASVAVGAPDDVQNVVVMVAGSRLLQVGAGDLQARDLVELLQVSEVGVLGQLLRDVRLQQLAL